MQYDEFSLRHIGPGESDTKKMLSSLEVESIEELLTQTIPQEIRLKSPLSLPKGISENKFLTELRTLSDENKLFETLDTKISYFYLPLSKKAYINDTVGFISDLPTLLVQAFRSTLDEVTQADLLIHVRDISVNNIEDQKNDVLEVLRQLNIFPNTLEGPKMLEVFNKVDIADNEIRKGLFKSPNSFFISAKTGEGLNELKAKIDEILYSLFQNKL